MPKLKPHARRALIEERRQQILQAAITVFSDKGFDRATIAEIARVAGIAEGSIYNYFKSKDDLLVSIPRAALRPSVESATALLHAPSADALPPEQVLTLIARHLIATIRQNAPLFRILLTALPVLSPRAREKYMRQVVLYVTGLLEEYFRHQIAHGVFRQELHSVHLATAFIGMFVPLVIFREVLQIESVPVSDYEQLIRTNVTLFLRGALAEPKRAQKIKVE